MIWYSYSIWMQSKFIENRRGTECGYVVAKNYEDAVAKLTNRYLGMIVLSINIEAIDLMADNDIIITEPFI